MSATLKVRLRRSEGALLRLLGQIGRRGYDVLGVSARLVENRSVFDVTVEFEPIVPLTNAPRPAEVLPRLVGKLVDVLQVELASVPPAGPPTAPPRGGASPDPRRVAGEVQWEE